MYCISNNHRRVHALASLYGQVRGVILDPSCSGSGTVVTRMDHLLPQAAAEQVADEEANQQGGDAAGAGSSMSAKQQRVEQLAKFQVGHGGNS